MAMTAWIVGYVVIGVLFLGVFLSNDARKPEEEQAASAALSCLFAAVWPLTFVLLVGFSLGSIAESRK
jgi:hypothetical protein